MAGGNFLSGFSPLDHHHDFQEPQEHPPSCKGFKPAVGQNKKKNTLINIALIIDCSAIFCTFIFQEYFKYLWGQM